MKAQKSHFTPFKSSIQSIELPQRFNFPFYYQPHKLSLIASQELQDYLVSQSEWDHTNINLAMQVAVFNYCK